MYVTTTHRRTSVGHPILLFPRKSGYVRNRFEYRTVARDERYASGWFCDMRNTTCSRKRRRDQTNASITRRGKIRRSDRCRNGFILSVNTRIATLTRFDTADTRSSCPAMTLKFEYKTEAKRNVPVPKTAHGRNEDISLFVHATLFRPAVARYFCSQRRPFQSTERSTLVVCLRLRDVYWDVSSVPRRTAKAYLKGT